MVKLGFSLQEHYTVPTEQVIDLLADTGFCAISPGWQRDSDLGNIVRHARMRSLTVQSLHGPLRGMRAMWKPDPEDMLQDLLQSATDCAALDIPMLVVHPWNGTQYTFCRDGICFDHFDRLVDHCEELGIQIAFENLEGPEYLCALLERYVNQEAVGFCWDSGHEACYTPGWDFLSRFGDRLIMTHLNDNLGVTDPTGLLQGTDDLHLLCGDGILDWTAIIRRLSLARGQEILNFELKIRPKGDRCKLDLYSQLPLQDYFRQAYQRALTVTKLYERSAVHCSPNAIP